MSSAGYQSGDFIGDYILREKLGSGGFGEVWKAQPQGTGESVALKILKQEADLKSLVREQEALHRLGHPNIVKILGGELRHEPPYIVMEYVAGGSLEDLLKKRGKLPVSETLNIFRKVAQGVAYAHENGFVHRDLKPANVLLGENDEVKVCDFGLGRAVEKESLSISMETKHEGIVGTLEYMAPEQAQGKPGDEKSDVYALGRILFRLISGCLPSGMDESLVEFVTGSTAVDLDKIYNNCCAGVDRRYEDAPHLLEDIDKLSAGEKIVKITSPVMKSAKEERQNRFGSMSLRGSVLHFSHGDRLYTRINLRDIHSITWKMKFYWINMILFLGVIIIFLIVGLIYTAFDGIFEWGFLVLVIPIIYIAVLRENESNKNLWQKAVIEIKSSVGAYTFEERGKRKKLEWFLNEIMQRAHQLGNRMTVEKIKK